MPAVTSTLHRGLTFLAISVLALGAACGGSAKSADGPPGPASTLRLGYFANVTHAAAIIGVDRGLIVKELGATKWGICEARRWPAPSSVTPRTWRCVPG